MIHITGMSTYINIFPVLGEWPSIHLGSMIVGKLLRPATWNGPYRGIIPKCP